MPPDSGDQSCDAGTPSARSQAPAAAEELPLVAESGATPAAEADASAVVADANPAMVEQLPFIQAPPLASSGPEGPALLNEKAWLQQQNSVLQQQLAQLQQQHAALLAVPHGHPGAHHDQSTVPTQEYQMHHQQHYPVQQQAAQQQRTQMAPTPMPAMHNPAWTEQINPENGALYYWNQTTGESTYSRPQDYSPLGGDGMGGANALQVASTGNGSSLKGPPGANLFIVRKMRRGEYDTFTDEDLRREFGKYGTVTRAEITIDKETGWSKGYGFVSFATPQEADAAINAVHGSWMAGREMKVEKTNEDR